MVKVPELTTGENVSIEGQQNKKLIKKIIWANEHEGLDTLHCEVVYLPR